MNSKRKGSGGERELAKKLRGYGFKDCRRGQQYCGANGDADVVGLPFCHIECKRVERLNIDKAMQQAQEDCNEFKFPVVMHRKNGGEWMATMLLEDWAEFSKTFIEGK